MTANTSVPRPTGAGFLLAQIGAHGARRFGERIKVIDLAPPHAGILRLIHSMSDCSQKELAERLGILPSRMVILIDELGAKGLVERRRSTLDRRNYALVMTKQGTKVFRQLSVLAAQHEADLCSALSAEEKALLVKLCAKIAAQQGLVPNVHPGYRDL
jgi:DNA-binding MarR family transcriptional regulator